MKRFLIFNTGSSSIKYKLYNLPNENDLTLENKGKIEYIGTPYGPKNHSLALQILFNGVGFRTPTLGKISSLEAIGHRIVYGGEEYSKTTIITPEVIEGLHKYDLLAPLHNPPILKVMETIMAVAGRAGHRDVPNYAVFDTEYFKDLPRVEKIYPLPYHMYEKFGIRRFGFHGLSHRYVNSLVKNKYQKDNLKVISIHLGAGSSISANVDARPVATSMGYTPLEGLMMLTRAGDIDAGILIYLLRSKKMKPDAIENMLNHESGVKGIAGFSSDFRDVLFAAGYKVNDPDYQPSQDILHMPALYKDKANLAIEMYVQRIKKYIGAYYALLGGLDVLVFTGQIGTKSAVTRSLVTSGLDHILKNVNIEVIETDEELQIVRELVKIRG